MAFQETRASLSAYADARNFSLVTTFNKVSLRIIALQCAEIDIIYLGNHLSLFSAMYLQVYP